MGLSQGGFLILEIKDLILFASSAPKGLEFISNIIAFEGILIGAAIPISFQVVSWMADSFGERKIAKVFISEWIYRIQYLLFFFHILIGIVLRFLSPIYSEYRAYIFAGFFTWTIINTILFLEFIGTVQEYITEPEVIIRRKLMDHVKDLRQ